jgi:hypothetical protein
MERSVDNENGLVNTSSTAIPSEAILLSILVNGDVVVITIL